MAQAINRLGGSDKTYDVSSHELECVAPPLPTERSGDPPPQWLTLDYHFAITLAGMGVLMLASALMIFASLHEAEAPSTLQTANVVETAHVVPPPQPIETTIHTQTAQAKAPQHKQKVRRFRGHSRPPAARVSRSRQ